MYNSFLCSRSSLPFVVGAAVDQWYLGPDSLAPVSGCVAVAPIRQRLECLQQLSRVLRATVLQGQYRQSTIIQVI
jgi:hypothetical protein